MDPYYGLDTMMTQGAEREGEGEEDAQGAAQVMAEAQSEEERRRRVIESLLAGVPYPPDNIDDDDVDAENMTGEVHRQDRAGEENNGVVPAEQMLPWRRAEMEARAALEQAVSERVKAHQEAMLRERTELEEEELRMLEKDFSTGAGGGGDATAASVARAYDTVHKRATLNVNVNMNSVSINEQASDRVESEEDLKVRFRKEIEMAQELTTASKGR